VVVFDIIVEVSVTVFVFAATSSMSVLVKVILEVTGGRVMVLEAITVAVLVIVVGMVVVDVVLCK
jgi:hypothetical protein